MFHTHKTNPQDVPPAAPGMLRWFAGTDGKPYSIDEAGVLRDFKGEKGDKGDKGDQGLPGINGLDGLGAIPPGTLVVGRNDKTYEGFLKLGGYNVSADTYPRLLPFFNSSDTVTLGNPLDLSAVTLASSAVLSGVLTGLVDGATDPFSSQVGFSEGGHVQFQFAEAKTVKALKISSGQSARMTASFVIYGSNNGTDWTELGNYPYQLYEMWGWGAPVLSLPTTGAYTHYKLAFPMANWGSVWLTEIQLFDDATVTKNIWIPQQYEVTGNESMLSNWNWAWFVKY